MRGFKADVFLYNRHYVVMLSKLQNPLAVADMQEIEDKERLLR
jgi:hypothetical protein